MYTKYINTLMLMRKKLGSGCGKKVRNVKVVLPVLLLLYFPLLRNMEDSLGIPKISGDLLYKDITLECMRGGITYLSLYFIRQNIPYTF